jgi:hypothetical protein
LRDIAAPIGLVGQIRLCHLSGVTTGIHGVSELNELIVAGGRRVGRTAVSVHFRSTDVDVLQPTSVVRYGRGWYLAESEQI